MAYALQEVHVIDCLLHGKAEIRVLVVADRYATGITISTLRSTRYDGLRTMYRSTLCDCTILERP